MMAYKDNFRLEKNDLNYLYTNRYRGATPLTSPLTYHTEAGMLRYIKLTGG